MRVIYVPRKDARQVQGGDIIYMMQVKKHIQRLGVEIEIVAADALPHHAGGDLVHLTQIYQLDAAESALDWAERQQIPIVINPLFEEVLAMWFRWAIQRQIKWRRLAKVLGMDLAECIYTHWQTARRVHDSKWRRQRVLLQSSQVIPNTRYELDHLRRWFNLPDLTGSIVPLGVDAELYGAWETSAEEGLPVALQEHRGQYILQVGLLSLRKNQIGLLQALDQTNDIVVFLGRPTPHEPEYQEDVKRLAQARGNVIFIEYIEEKLLPVLYGNAQVHVLPSWSERPGMVSLEAAACGCKVISSNRAPIHEYLGDLAWYIDPAQSEQILATVQQVIASATPSGLREHALSFSWENTAQKLTDIYSAVLCGRFLST